MIRPHRLLFSALLPLAIAIGGCSQSPSPTAAPPQPAAQPKIISDDLGRPIKLAAPAKRIAVVGPGATEIIFALGAGDRLVGRDMISDYPPATKKIPIIGDYKGPFLESTLAVRPDLVIVQGETYDQIRAEDWSRKLKAPVAVINATNVKQLAADILKIGAWLDLDGKAKELTQPPPLPKRAPLRVFIEIQRAPLWTAGGDTLVGDAIKTAGLVNVAQGAHGYKPYSLESLLAQNPDVYVVTGKPADSARILKELRNQPGIRDLTCIKRGKLAIVEADWLLRPGPRLWQGIRALADAAHK